MNKLLTVIFFALSVSGYGQSGEWTWMKGDSIPSQPAIYGIQGVPSQANKPRSTYEGTDWKDLQGNFWLYDHSDLWKFNPSTLEWTWMKGTQGAQSYSVYGTKGIASPNNHPGWRYYCAASWVDTSGEFWFFGGASPNGGKSDLWNYNPATNEWTWINGDTLAYLAPTFGTKGVSSPTTNPGAKTETNATWVDSNNDLWLFGGDYDTTGLYLGSLNALWKYNIATNQWTWMSGDNYPNPTAVYGTKGIANPNNKPSGRWTYSKWIENDNLWLFGGRDFNLGIYNDLWKYNIASNEWTWMNGSDTINNHGIYLTKCASCTNCYPYSRGESRSCWKDFNGNFWLFGGTRMPTNFNDLWVYNPSINQWTWIFGDSIPSQMMPVYGTYQVPSPTNNPGFKNGSASWLDNYNNLWLFGGFNGPAFNDLWKYEIDSTCNGIFTSIPEFMTDNYIQIFPNPFNNKLTLRINDNELTEIILYDITSRKLLQQKFINSVSLNTEQLSRGLYLYEVRNKDGSFMKGKVVKH